MSITKKQFGEYNGTTVYEYVLINKNGLTAKILNYGGIIRKLIYKNIDVVLGRNTMKEYTNNEGYFSALFGRNSNRIKNSKFKLNGKNNLHGGKEGFDKKVWDAQMIDEE